MLHQQEHHNTSTKRTHDAQEVTIKADENMLQISGNRTEIQRLFKTISDFCDTIHTLNMEATGIDAAPCELMVEKNATDKITITGNWALLKQIFPYLDTTLSHSSIKDAKKIKV